MADASTVMADIRVRGEPGELASVRERVQRESEAAGFAVDVADKMVLAVDEALANVIRHGYGGPCDKPIDMRIELRVSANGREEICFIVRDYGHQTDPADIASRPLDDVKPGGLGVHIIKTVMDDVTYEPADGGGMRLVMRKQKPL